MIGKLPGMSYRQKQPEAHQAQHAKDENTNTVNITYHVHTGSDERRADQPQHRISHARNEDRIVNLSQEAQLAQ
jgi:hypothetical protein